MNEKQRDTDLLMVCTSDISGQVLLNPMPRFAIYNLRSTCFFSPPPPFSPFSLPLPLPNPHT